MTNPANVPSTPAAPQTTLLLLLGLVVGLALGAAAAIVRSRVDTALHTADDVRETWGDDDRTPLLTRPTGQAGRSALVGRPAAVLARRIELMAEDRPAQVLLLSPSPTPALQPWPLVDELAEELRAKGLATTVTAPGEDPTRLPAVAREDRARVRLVVGSSLLSLRSWRQVGDDFDGVVVVVAPGRVQRAELAEVRSVLTGAGIRPLAIVVGAAARRRAGRTTAESPAPADRVAQPASR